MDRVGKIISWNIQSREEGENWLKKQEKGDLAPVLPSLY